MVYSYNGILHRSKKENYWYIQQQRWVLQALCWLKGASYKNYVTYDSIYTKFKKRWNWSIVVEVRNVARTLQMWKGILINLNFISHMWLAATVLNSTGREDKSEDI